MHTLRQGTLVSRCTHSDRCRNVAGQACVHTFRHSVLLSRCTRSGVPFAHFRQDTKLSSYSHLDRTLLSQCTRLDRTHIQTGCIMSRCTHLDRTCCCLDEHIQTEHIALSMHTFRQNMLLSQFTRSDRTHCFDSYLKGTHNYTNDEMHMLLGPTLSCIIPRDLVCTLSDMPSPHLFTF